jgi:hypothetical protein
MLEVSINRLLRKRHTIVSLLINQTRISTFRRKRTDKKRTRKHQYQLFEEEENSALFTVFHEHSCHGRVTTIASPMQRSHLRGINLKEIRFLLEEEEEEEENGLK